MIRFICLLLLAGYVRVHGYVTPFRSVSQLARFSLYCIEKMTLDELKSELDVRSVNYDDCFSKNELAQRLKESRLHSLTHLLTYSLTNSLTQRLTGKADPSIIDKFNNLEIDDEILNDDEVLDQVKAQDGSLVGGLTPEQMKKLR